MDFLNLIFGVITVISLAFTIYYGIKSTRLEKQRKKINWQDLQSSAKDLVNDLKKIKYTPNIIFTPGLRGATFANLVKDEIGKELPVFVGISYWKTSNVDSLKIDDYLTIETSKWYILIPKLIIQDRNNKILIIDDYVMSGDFLQSLKELLIKSGIRDENIKSIAIVTSKIAKEGNKAPDFYWIETTDSNFYFPWGKAK